MRKSLEPPIENYADELASELETFAALPDKRIDENIEGVSELFENRPQRVRSLYDSSTQLPQEIFYEWLILEAKGELPELKPEVKDDIRRMRSLFEENDMQLLWVDPDELPETLSGVLEQDSLTDSEITEIKQSGAVVDVTRVDERPTVKGSNSFRRVLVSPQ